MSREDVWKVYEEEIQSSSIHYGDQSVQDCLQLHHLQVLLDSLSRLESVKTPHFRRTRTRDSGLSLEQFCSVLSGSCDRVKMEELFLEMDSAGDGYVDLEKLSRYILHHQQREEESAARHPIISPDPVIRPCLTNRREPIIRVLEVSDPPPLRYISISKGGTLTIWNSQLHIINSLELCKDAGGKGSSGGRSLGWMIDSVYMPNVQKIAVASMCRDLHLISVSANGCSEEYHLTGLSHVATALCYWYNVKAPEQRSVLMWGDERGVVSLLWFLEPHTGLFHTHYSNQTHTQQLLFTDICAQISLISYQQTPQIHNLPINRIRYEPQSELIITSSESDSSSVVIMSVNQKHKTYTWKIEKGVECFDISWTLGLLVTSGLDPTVRIWSRFVPSRPSAVLQGHRTCVLDLIIHQETQKIFSYSRDAVLKIWDISTHHCVKSLTLRFPNIQAGRIPEQGRVPLLLSQAGAPALLVSCREYVALLRLQDQTSRPGPVKFTNVLYIPHLKQVVTACTGSCVMVWDVETGRKLMEIRNTHGQEEITAMTTDQNRLITAAANGTIKVWSLLNGLLLHKLETVSDTEVTEVMCLHDNQLLAVGWSRLVVQYSINDVHEVCVKADVWSRSAQLHSEDIMSADVCPHLRLLATGSYNGEIIIWTLDTQSPVTRHQRPQPGSVYPPIDRLLFLQSRAQDRLWKNRALLLSSQAGYICWWSVCGPTHCHGRFYAPHKQDECVKTLQTNHNNTLLITGDTTGSVHMWDISHYNPSTGSECPPPLVHTWRAHQGAVVSLQLLELQAGVFLLSVCEDHQASVWSSVGVCVGCLGHNWVWDLHNPHTYKHNNSQSKEEGKDTTEISQSENTDLTSGGQSSEVEVRLKKSQNEDDPQPTVFLGPNPEAHHSSCEVLSRVSGAECLKSLKSSDPVQYRQALFTQGALGQDRHQKFGDMDTTKLYRIGHEVSPYQALKLQDIKKVEDFTSKSWRMKMKESYTSLLSSDDSAYVGTSDT